MIKYDNFDKLKNSDEYTWYDREKMKLSKEDMKALEKLEFDVNLDDRYSMAQLTLLKIENNYVVSWKIASDWGNDYEILYHKPTKSLVTLKDIVELIKKKEFKGNFVKICKKNEWSILNYNEEKKKNSKKEIKGKINFDIKKIDNLWRKYNRGDKQMSDNEKKQLVDATHKLLDIFADKADGGTFGLYMYAELLKLLDLN